MLHQHASLSRQTVVQISGTQARQTRQLRFFSSFFGKGEGEGEGYEGEGGEGYEGEGYKDEGYEGHEGEGYEGEGYEGEGEGEGSKCGLLCQKLRLKKGLLFGHH